MISDSISRISTGSFSITIKQRFSSRVLQFWHIATLCRKLIQGRLTAKSVNHFYFVFVVSSRSFAFIQPTAPVLDLIMYHAPAAPDALPRRVTSSPTSKLRDNLRLRILLSVKHASGGFHPEARGQSFDWPRKQRHCGSRRVAALPSKPPDDIDGLARCPVPGTGLHPDEPSSGIDQISCRQSPNR